ncbi:MULTISPECIES: HPr kinase/phosphorylase [Alphaproteobacteria]|uniref:HPr kinase/phosphorylase C-terminal domain-containing protein n=2 Tax=Alphaproteobacteria TaxID=28211 RepID=A0A512HM94_9HYPH|nr:MULTISPECIES: HPr kinase/phosphorylase [Alphaproteobacteria]GEO86564.1 hypothetical protein RNA01_34960 [Ciceribacter naphthalenivorans]GLR20864.1 hypothetical protein GCM10007920_06480 [Ciceribacter naphthalenivorans]GLT03720.1 hypothetical protein GCM10007926_06480 [Sphingomonas psychrolutea]
MSGRGVNIHATAIVVGTTGLVFIGPSGSGKSMLAFDCLCEARLHGQFAALVADDQVFISRFGTHVVASRPETIKDLIELRHGGIARIASIPRALLHYAVVPVIRGEAKRLPPEKARETLFGEVSLPALHVPSDLRLPFSFINALIAS